MELGAETWLFFVDAFHQTNRQSDADSRAILHGSLPAPDSLPSLSFGALELRKLHTILTVLCKYGATQFAGHVTLHQGLPSSVLAGVSSFL